jgi:hypothetical protein
VSAAWYSLPKPTEPHDAVEMGKQLSPADRSDRKAHPRASPIKPRQDALITAFSSETIGN